MSDTSNNEAGKPKDESQGQNESAKDIELNEAFARLEKQVEQNQAAPTASAKKPMKGAAEKRSRPDSDSGGSGGGLLGALALILALVAIGLGSFSAYTLWQQQQAGAVGQDQQATQNQELQRELASLRRELAQVRAAQSGTDGQVQAEVQGIIAAQVKANEALEKRVEVSVAELKNQIGTTAQDWLLAEAEYLLRLANQRVAMEDDVRGAIALFESADKIIREAEGVVAFDLRQAIANDIAALKGVAATDTEGIFVRLGAIATQIPKLQQKQLTFVQPTLPDVAENTELTFTQRAMAVVTRFGQHLSNLVDYRSGGEVITPILPPDEEYYLQQNLLLKIQLAQLGLLRGNQEIYNQSIADAKAWIERYFDLASPTTLGVVSTLEQLDGVTVTRDLPDVSASLTEIRALMARFHETEERRS